MTDLTPIAALDPVVQLETNTLALGGTGNPMNQQAQALLNRDAFRAAQIAEKASSSDLANDTDPGKGAGLLGYRGRTAGDALDDSITVESFNLSGLGPADNWNSVFDAARAFSTVVRVPAGLTVNLQNWAAPAGTTIVATGATINRFNDDLYSTTGSAGAIVITNNDIEIIGGTWGRGAAATNFSFSGSLLIESGSLKVRGGIYDNTWGGIFGHEVQNGSLVASHVLLDGVEIRNCSHNTYLADIENFTICNSRSHGSSRDGLRVFRNVQNLIIGFNHFYNNGNLDATQSQDGMDLFYGGKRCIIIGNHIYDNDYKGIDIKRGLASAGEVVFGQEMLILGNHIHGNLKGGIELAQSLVPEEYNKNIKIESNYIYDNRLYGVKLDYTQNVDLKNNHIYENDWTGVRIDNSIKPSITGNKIYDNGKALVGGNQIGIQIISTVADFLVTDNTVYDSGSGSQVSGILLDGTGRCYDNNVSGHSANDIFVTPKSGAIKGKSVRQRVASATAGLQYIGVLDRASCISGARLTAANNSDVDFTLTKRNPTTGAAGSTLYTGTAETQVANLPRYLSAGWGSDTARKLVDNELLCMTITSATVAFTMGEIEIQYVD